MNKPSAIAALLIALFTSAAAFADDVKTSYTAEVKGIVCQACAADVKAAFARLPGVKEVEIKKVVEEFKG